MSIGEVPGYCGVAFVRAITTVRAELYRVEPPAETASGPVAWRGQLREAVGWARRYNADTRSEEQLGVGDSIELEIPGHDDPAHAIITALWLLQPDSVSFRLNTAVDIIGLGEPPFATEPELGSPPAAGDREPRRPSPKGPHTMSEQRQRHA